MTDLRSDYQQRLSKLSGQVEPEFYSHPASQFIRSNVAIKIWSCSMGSLTLYQTRIIMELLTCFTG